MNWEKYQVSVSEYKNLVNYNEPIRVPDGSLEANIGVEVYTTDGNIMNAIYDANLGAIRKLNGFNPQFRTMPNRDLLLYNDHLLNDDINTIIVDGFYGTAKTSTVMSHLVYGLMNFLEGQTGIPKAYLSKPHEGIGNSYGHLPGSLKEKTDPEFASYTQYFDRYGKPGLADVLMGIDECVNFNMFDDEDTKPRVKVLEILVFEYLRGRDIDSGWVILDESQNTSEKEMDSFISRVTDDAKLIIIGDTTPSQIDKRGNTVERNGLTHAKNIYKGKKYAGCVELKSKKHILRGNRVKDLWEYAVNQTR